MTRVTTGRPLRSHISEALSRAFLGTPEGWTFCGFMGLIAMTNRYAGMVGCMLIDLSLIERDHCYGALNRSIERASNAKLDRDL